MVKIDIPMPNSCTECPFAYVDYTTNIPGCDVMADLPNCPDYDIHTKTEQKDKNCPLSAIYDCEDAVSRRRLLNDLKELIAAWKKYPVMAEQIKGVETTIGYVELIPPVTPKRTGKWMNLQLIPDDITGHTYGECSICGKLRIVDNYCPNCGSFNGGYDVNE